MHEACVGSRWDVCTLASDFAGHDYADYDLDSPDHGTASAPVVPRGMSVVPPQPALLMNLCLVL